MWMWLDWLNLTQNGIDTGGDKGPGSTTWGCWVAKEKNMEDLGAGRGRF
jgi:hypothetical protein